MPHKLILNKGDEKQVHEYEDIEQAFNAAVPWVMKGYIAPLPTSRGPSNTRKRWPTAKSPGTPVTRPRGGVAQAKRRAARRPLPTPAVVAVVAVVTRSRCRGGASHYCPDALAEPGAVPYPQAGERGVQAR
jgi:hypothetical protein